MPKYEKSLSLLLSKYFNFVLLTSLISINALFIVLKAGFDDLI